jgi:hypothetical protein
MKRTSILVIGVFFIIHALQAQIINKVPLSERITGYKMDVKLDTGVKTVSGNMEAFWVNKSPDTVPDIRMHLYMNAFRSNRTTFYTESGNSDWEVSPGEKDIDLGWIEIKSFENNKGVDLMPAIEYISPDDGNKEDRTVLRVMLPDPAMPGDTVFVNVNFETKLPSHIRRTGYTNDFYFVAQWFPKFGVYEPAGMRYASKGGWNCHQFHANSEFYSDHSVYDVTVTLPSDYVTGSGGILISESVNEESKIQVFRAEDIVDFAWTAWPGYAVFKDKWNHVNITLLIPKDRIKQVDRQFTAIKHALEYLTENVGPYPWPHLTFVDPPSIGSRAGGMEYTTLFTSESSYFMPSFFHMPEMVTVHEFGHAYFMGILASNEFEEPWLDEGVNSYWEERIMDHYYGSNSGLMNHKLFKVSDKTSARLAYTMSSARQTISNNEYSWNYPHGTYGMMAYQKTATWLHTLTGIVGEETMDNVFREYYRKWAFKHPSGKDFVNVVNEVVKKEHGEEFGPDMNWFFDQTLYGTGICDYKVSGIFNRKYHKPTGKADNTDPIKEIWPHTDSLYTATAQLERTGDVMLPVDVLIHFTNGDEILEKWNGKERYKDFVYTGYREIQWVKIDPDFKIKMDVNYNNNSMTEKPDRKPLHRLINKMIAFIQFYLSVILL